MPTLEDVRRLHDFHRWATDRALDAAAPVTAGQLDLPWGGSFGSGRGLLRHVVGAERLWLERWRGTSLQSIPEFPPAAGGRDFRDAWRAVAAEQHAFLEALTAERLSTPLTYVNLKGETWTYPLADILLHCANHGTYHRGQITHLLRDLGMAAPSTDFLIFADERRRG